MVRCVGVYYAWINAAYCRVVTFCNVEFFVRFVLILDACLKGHEIDGRRGVTARPSTGSPVQVDQLRTRVDRESRIVLLLLFLLLSAQA